MVKTFLSVACALILVALSGPCGALNKAAHMLSGAIAYNELNENVMRQAASLRGPELPMLLPGIKINTSASDYFSLKQAQVMRFDGKEWVRFVEFLALNNAECQ